jgi:hypothetical protein
MTERYGPSFSTSEGDFLVDLGESAGLSEGAGGHSKGLSQSAIRMMESFYLSCGISIMKNFGGRNPAFDHGGV